MGGRVAAEGGDHGRRGAGWRSMQSVRRGRQRALPAVLPGGAGGRAVKVVKRAWLARCVARLGGSERWLPALPEPDSGPRGSLGDV